MSSQDTRQRAEYERDRAIRLEEEAEAILRNAQHEADAKRQQAQDHNREVERLERQARDEQKHEDEERARERQHDNDHSVVKEVVKRSIF